MSRIISFEKAKNQYAHRFTMEFVPEWAKSVCEGNGKFYAPSYRTDKEWYDNSVFPGEKGVDKNSLYCEPVNQSWPLGQWLDKPYSINQTENAQFEKATGNEIVSSQLEELTRRIIKNADTARRLPLNNVQWIETETTVKTANLIREYFGLPAIKIERYVHNVETLPQ